MNTMTTSPLRLARLAAGLRQVDLAATIGRSRLFICRLEIGGYARLTPEIAETLAAAVNVPAALLFARRNAPRPSPLESLLPRAERRDLARKLGVSQREITAILRGDRHVAEGRVVAEVAKALGVSVEYLPHPPERGAA